MSLARGQPERCVEVIVGRSGSDGSKPRHGLQEELTGLGVVSLLFKVVHLYLKSGVLDRGLVFLGEVKLALLIETRVGVSLTEGLEGSPVLG
jgi:hypothetical protein